MPIQTRSIPKQLLYLLIAFAGLLAILTLLAYWQV
jgi:hypothetical protein